MLPNDLKDFRSDERDDMFRFLAPDVAAAILFAALCVVLIAERMGIL